ncbi:hypothetical protein KSS87_023180 [Heliosperma pusillum]|nr:hypothetical protein KSS87_023180 [Heliosperma pusillum]
MYHVLYPRKPPIFSKGVYGVQFITQHYLPLRFAMTCILNYFTRYLGIFSVESDDAILRLDIASSFP